jgi:hypothetical protein
MFYTLGQASPSQKSLDLRTFGLIILVSWIQSNYIGATHLTLPMLLNTYQSSSSKLDVDLGNGQKPVNFEQTHLQL